ncbi:hypothetical protein Tco_0841072 [Tanacetum coccineum]|uniref:Uncharacterized protein n=1 Tax=Tanacetum coccineum TaxID=301880 RepID=A0ABQ5AVD9_9ASTR
MLSNSLHSTTQNLEITTDVPEIYMQEFWVTVSRHHSSHIVQAECQSQTSNSQCIQPGRSLLPKLNKMSLSGKNNYALEQVFEADQMKLSTQEKQAKNSTALYASAQKSEEESWTFSQGEDDEENDEQDSEDDNDRT